MTTLVARLRAKVDEDVNEPVERLLDDAGGRVEALEIRLSLRAAAPRAASRPGAAPSRSNTRQDQRSI